MTEVRPQQPLVARPHHIRLAMIGCTSGNGHPYSWSAMFNGYSREMMTRECPFDGIPVYLNKQPKDTLTIPGATVTHVCCQGDGGFTAEHVAACSNIECVVDDPVDVIGHVDAVVIATDDGSEHVERARPFVEVGLPVFVDKPLADNRDDLDTFVDWIERGKPIMSSSCMRYAKEFLPYRQSTHDLGALRFVSITTPKPGSVTASMPWRPSTRSWVRVSYRPETPAMQRATSFTSNTTRASTPWWQPRPTWSAPSVACSYAAPPVMHRLPLVIPSMLSRPSWKHSYPTFAPACVRSRSMRRWTW